MLSAENRCGPNYQYRFHIIAPSKCCDQLVPYVGLIFARGLCGSVYIHYIGVRYLFYSLVNKSPLQVSHLDDTREYAQNTEAAMVALHFGPIWRFFGYHGAAVY